MNKKQFFKWIFVAILLCTAFMIVSFFRPVKGMPVNIGMTTSSDINENDAYKIYYVTNINDEFEETKSVYADVKSGQENRISFSVPYNTKRIRIDVGSHPGNIELRDIYFECNKIDVTDNVELDEVRDVSGIEQISYKDKKYTINAATEDPFFVIDVSGILGNEELNVKISIYNYIIVTVICAVILLIIIFFLRNFDTYIEFPAEVYNSKKLILQLSKNDFKTKYAGSYLGIVWAFVQPIVTVLVYWFVFEKGLKSGGVSEVPFVLWLIAGLVPWFFFSDALNGGTNALIEYQYLVKKVVFQINILPIVKLLSAFYVHLFFVFFTLILYACYGYYPDLYTIQIVYYSFCMFALVTGLCYITSAVVGFFRDLTQIINIILQVGVWMTPIMWNIDVMDLPGWLKIVFKANPMYYIVSGYRDALINKVWFWQNAGLTLYFWLLTIIVIGLGMTIFRKLRVHFADVL